MSSVARWLLGDFGAAEAHERVEASASTPEGARRIGEAGRLAGQLGKLAEQQKTGGGDVTALGELVTQLHELAQHGETHETIGEAMSALVRCLALFRGQVEPLRDCIELITTVCRPLGVSISIESDGAAASESTASEGTTGGHHASYVQLVNTEQFVGSGDGLGSLLAALTETDFGVLYAGIELIKVLLFNGKLTTLQAALYGQQGGVDCLLRLLNDRRDALRNEAILLLIALTREHEDLQKVLGFNNVFERLAAIMAEERMGEGSVVVSDCLRLMNSLLRDSASNQSYFREIGCLGKIYPAILRVQASEFWLLSDQRAAILLEALRLVGVLLSVSSAHAELSKNQQTLARCGLLPALLDLALRRLNCTPVRVQALRTLGAFIAGSQQLCSDFHATRLQDNDIKAPQETFALVRLGKVMLDAADVQEQLGALYVFKAFLDSDDNGQMLMAATFTPLPGSEDVRRDAAEPKSEQTAIGRMLIAAALAWRTDLPLRSCFAARLLSRIFVDNADAKRHAVKIPLALPQPARPEPPYLLPSVAAALRDATAQSAPVQICFGLLQLLCHWLVDYPAGVELFVADAAGANVPCCVEMLTHRHAAVAVRALAALLLGIVWLELPASAPQRAQFFQLINHRVGVTKYLAALDALRKSLPFIVAEQSQSPLDLMASSSPVVATDSSIAVCLDHDFAEFFKATCERILTELRTAGASLPSTPMKTLRRSHLSSSSSSSQQIQPQIQPQQPQQQQQQQSQVDVAAQQRSLVEPLLARIAELEALQNQAQLEAQEAAAYQTSLEGALQDLTKAYDVLETHLGELQQKPPPVEPARGHDDSELKDARIAELEQLLKKQEELYSALERDQEELLIAFGKTDLENQHLKAEVQRLRAQLDPSPAIV